MSEKYIRVEDFKNEIAGLGDLRTLSTKTIGEALARCPTYTPAEIMAGMWVLAEEEMPDIGDEVLIRIDHDVMPVYYDMAEYEGEGVFRTHFGHLLYMEVTHWMPLPPKSDVK